MIWSFAISGGEAMTTPPIKDCLHYEMLNTSPLRSTSNHLKSSPQDMPTVHLYNFSPLLAQRPVLLILEVAMEETTRSSGSIIWKLSPELLPHGNHFVLVAIMTPGSPWMKTQVEESLCSQPEWMTHISVNFAQTVSTNRTNQMRCDLNAFLNSCATYDHEGFFDSIMRESTVDHGSDLTTYDLLGKKTSLQGTRSHSQYPNVQFTYQHAWMQTPSIWTPCSPTTPPARARFSLSPRSFPPWPSHLWSRSSPANYL